MQQEQTTLSIKITIQVRPHQRVYTSYLLVILSLSSRQKGLTKIVSKINFLPFFLRICFFCRTFEHLPWLYNPHKTIHKSQFPRSYCLIMQPIHAGFALTQNDTVVPSDAACAKAHSPESTVALCSPYARILHLKASFCAKFLHMCIFCCTFAI